MNTDNTMKVKNEYVVPQVELVELVTENSTLQIASPTSLEDYGDNPIFGG